MSENGSSPHGRGKRRWTGFAQYEGGIIPARAGKTTTTTTLCRAQTDHPRAGGENLTSVAMSLWVFGSSPRGRGKPTRELESFTVPGIIPARAGKTYGDSATRNRLRDHPRAGGENGYTPGRDIYHFGSSPRGRGKPRPSCGDVSAQRIIPARAGKTRIESVGKLRLGDHPRAGGENLNPLVSFHP